MCSKHDACCSGKVSAPEKKESCSSSPAMTHMTPVGEVHQDHAECGDSGCSGGDPGDDEEGSITSDARYSKSWQVEGMDCPSCARKIETAVNRLSGIVDARVLFATEKLVVQFNDLSVAAAVEDAVIRTGFAIRQSDAEIHSQSGSGGGWGSVFGQNREIILIASGMVVAAAVKLWSPAASQVLFVLTCVIGLIPIARKAWQLTLSGTPFAIETLMTVAALGALYLGETAEATMVLLLFLIGERLEGVAAAKARSGVQALMELVPESAVKIVNGERINVAARELNPGDIIEVSPGGRLPADGVLNDDSASFDESALTGESIPVERFQGEPLAAGSVAADKVIRVTITSKQGENAIDRILHMIEEAESRKAPIECFLDKFSRWYTPLMMAVALLVVLLPPLMFAQPWETWVYRGLALLLIACPCALVISTPAAITSGLAAAARRGALIKGGAALERLGRIETIAIDKTGTLTKGKPAVTDSIPLNGWSEAHMLAVSAAVEVGSSHPLAVSLIKQAASMNIALPEAQNKKALPGRGVSGEIDGKTYQLLAPGKAGIALTADIEKQIARLETAGKTVVLVLEEQQPIGLVGWQDTLRDDAAIAVKQLHQRGIKVVMLTGDNRRSAAAISEVLNIDYQAGLLPEDKVRYVGQLSDNSRVAMVGDGINDAPAMKAADIGIAMGSGTDVALETADAAITHNRLPELAHMIELSQSTLNNIRQNVTLALGLKGVFLVTSLFGITGLWVAVLADSGATALVTLNALRLLRYKPKV